MFGPGFTKSLTSGSGSTGRSTAATGTVLYCNVLYCAVLYRGNRSGDLQDAYLDRINAGEEHFSAEVSEYIHTVAGNICFAQNLAAIVREIFVIGAESESVMMR